MESMKQEMEKLFKDEENDMLMNTTTEENKGCGVEGCDGSGYILKNLNFVKCPGCGNKEKGLEELSEDARRVIPELYRDILFDESKVIRNDLLKSVAYDMASVTKYANNLKQIYNIISLGQSLRRSVFVSAPQGLGKNHFVYACMNALARNGENIAEYLDTKEILDKINKCDTDDLERAKVLFIKFPVGLADKTDTQVIKQITDRRARKGKATIATCRFNTKYLFKIEINLDRFIVSEATKDMENDLFRMILVQCNQPSQEKAGRYNG